MYVPYDTFREEDPSLAINCITSNTNISNIIAKTGSSAATALPTTFFSNHSPDTPARRRASKQTSDGGRPRPSESKRETGGM